MKPRRGRLITLEGIDGAGKSTHVAWLGEELRRRGHEVVQTREPGGTVVGERLREMLLSEPMSVQTEAMLMFAARAEHLAEVIEPCLVAGKWIVCDRFTDASFAYQGGGKGLSDSRLSILETWVQGDLQPDLTFLFDLPAESARERRLRARAADKFEREDEAFFTRVRTAYLARAQMATTRIVVIDGSQPIDAIRRDLVHSLDALEARKTHKIVEKKL
jgi:dTMP kinase